MYLVPIYVGVPIIIWITVSWDCPQHRLRWALGSVPSTYIRRCTHNYMDYCELGLPSAQAKVDTGHWALGSVPSAVHV